MEIKEIKLEDLVVEEFVNQQMKNISNTVGDGRAINALSGGVDSSTVTILAHKALGKNLLTYFIDNGLMREGEPEYIVSIFKGLGIPVKIIDAGDKFLYALKGIEDPEEKRDAVTDTYYPIVFGQLARETGAKFLFQGTNYLDWLETVVLKLKRQHNILEQLGIDTVKKYGYKVIEPLIQFRKPAIRKIGKALGLPEEIYNRMPFPGPALAARIIGEVTREKVGIVRKVTKIVEDELKDSGAFQYLAVLHKEELEELESTYELARVIGEPTQERFELVNQAAKIVLEIIGEDYLTILHEDRVTGVRDGKRDYGLQIEIRNRDKPGKLTLPWETLDNLAEGITSKVSGIVSVNYDITPELKSIDNGSQIEVRSWDSTDARTATPTRLPHETLEKLAKRMITELSGIGKVTYNTTPKPPSTIEAI